MTERRSLGYDAWGQMEEFVEFDGDDVARVVFRGDNEAQLDFNKIQQNDGSNGWSESKELRKIIELDYTSYLLIATMHGVRPCSRDHDELILRLAQSDEWRHIKTVDGKVRDKMIAPKWV